jgi:hypothetical protein
MYLPAVDLLTYMVLIGEGTDRQGQGRGELAGDAILGQASRSVTSLKRRKRLRRRRCSERKACLSPPAA